MALLGIGSRFLNYSNKFLGYANEAVLPFYILHQPVILSIGYFVVQWTLPIIAKYFIIASTSFIAIMVLYELLVRRINVLRFLFGMRLKNISNSIGDREPNLVHFTVSYPVQVGGWLMLY